MARARASVCASLCRLPLKAHQSKRVLRGFGCRDTLQRPQRFPKIRSAALYPKAREKNSVKRARKTESGEVIADVYSL